MLVVLTVEGIVQGVFCFSLVGVLTVEGIV